MLLFTVITKRTLKLMWYAPILAFAMLLMMMRTLLMARVLDIPSFGEFAAGQLVSNTVSNLACLGLLPVLQRDLPAWLMQGRARAGLVLLTQCIVVGCACTLLGVAMGLFGMWFGEISPSLISYGVLHGFAQQIFALATVESRSRGEALRFATQHLIRSLTVCCCGIVVATCSGSACLVLAAETMVALFMSMAIFRRVFARARIAMPSAVALGVRRLGRAPWKSAMGLLSISVVGFGTLNLDRWIGATTLDASRFSEYSFICIVLLIAQLVQSLVSATAFPMLVRRSAHDGLHAGFRIALRMTMASVIVGALGCVPAWYILKLSIEKWFPAYSDAKDLLPLFLGIGVLRIADYLSAFLIIAGREWQLLIVNVGVLLLAFITWALFIRPWQGASLQLQDLGLLAALLSVGSLAGTGILSCYVVMHLSPCFRHLMGREC